VADEVALLQQPSLRSSSNHHFDLKQLHDSNIFEQLSFPVFFGVSLLIISPLLKGNLSSPPEMFSHHYQEAYFHILRLYVSSFTHGWSQRIKIYFKKDCNARI
jgi:hypothetical protein